MKLKAVFIYFIIALFAVLGMQAQTTEEEIVSAMYSGATDATDLSGDLISYAAHAVWAASTQTSQLTTTGTLTQSTTNPDKWTYSVSPADKMVLKFSNGSIMYFQYTTITGYTDGTIDDFLDAHQMDFVSEISNKLSLHIVSNIGYNSGTEKTEWDRAITGTVNIEGIAYTVNLNYTGDKKGDVGTSITIYDYTDKTTGTISSIQVNYTIDQAYRSHSAASSDGTYAQDRFSLNNSAAQTATAAYKFSDAYCKWLSITYPADTAYTVVNEPYHWEASGQLLKDNTTFGNVQFDRTVAEGTFGPHLVAHCYNGKDYLLSMLLNPIADGIGETTKPVSSVKLMQNYPNPFTGTTEIAYELQKQGQILLEIFDPTGKKLSTLVNKMQQPGNYKVRFSAKNLPAGHYSYRLKANGFETVKRMILMK